MFYHAGATAALIKLGFGPQDAARVSQVAKKIKLPKASQRILGGATGGGPAGLANPRRIKEDLSSISGLANKVKDTGTDMGKLMGHQLNAMVQASQPLAAVSKRLPQGAIIPGKGNTDTFLRKRLGEQIDARLPQVGPKDKRMINSIIDGHELDETLVRGGLAVRGVGHRSPDVLLREHNRVTTLPKEYGGSREFMKSMRGSTGETGLFQNIDPRLAYGDSPRLSRHARKRITELMEKDTTDQIMQSARMM
jgi:hypothetical protein